MRAAYYEKNGSAREVLRVGEIETPQAGPGEVRVKLATSGVNPSDVKSRQGLTRKIAWPRVIPHSDGAGVIDQVGDGVSKSRIGERVWLWNGQWKRAFGTAAEFIALPSAQAVKLPDAVSFEAGACLGIPAMTASHAVTLSHAVKGTTLLIAGGAGAVSQYAIQFAKAVGARVIATVSSAEKAKVALEAGADHAIDYKRENVGERVMAITDKHGVDAVIELDLAANAKLIPSVLRPKGSVIVYGTGATEATLPSFFCLTQSIRVQFFLVYELDHAMRERELTAINSALAHGTLHHRVAQPTFALADIAAAHEAVEKGAIVVAALGLRTVVRNMDWASNRVLFLTDVTTHPEDAHLNRCYGYTLLQMSEHGATPDEARAQREAARWHFDRALRAYPGFADALQLRGQTRALMGDTAGARLDLENAIQLQPKHRGARQALAELQAREQGGDVEQHLAALEQRVRAHPADSALRLEYGSALLESGRDAAALEQLREAVKLDPRNAVALRRLGEVLAILQKNDEAKEMFERVLQLDPNDWQAHTNLVQLVVPHDPAAALRHAQRAYELQPNDVRTWLNLAGAYAADGQTAMALEFYGKIERGLDEGSALRRFINERIEVLRRRQRP